MTAREIDAELSAAHQRNFDATWARWQERMREEATQAWWEARLGSLPDWMDTPGDDEPQETEEATQP